MNNRTTHIDTDAERYSDVLNEISTIRFNFINRGGLFYTVYDRQDLLFTISYEAFLRQMKTFKSSKDIVFNDFFFNGKH